jgi:hypothetical protein
MNIASFAFQQHTLMAMACKELAPLACLAARGSTTFPVIRFFHADGIIDPALLDILSVYIWPFFGLKARMVGLSERPRSRCVKNVQGRLSHDASDVPRTGIVKRGNYGFHPERLMEQTNAVQRTDKTRLHALT